VDQEGRIYIADTWNSRIQIMLPDADQRQYSRNITWDVNAWYSESLENKPFLAIDQDNNVYVADPVMGRVLVFDFDGNFLFAFGGFGSNSNEIGVVGGIAIDADGNVWVSDALNNRLMRFAVEDMPLGIESSEGQTLLNQIEEGDSQDTGNQDSSNP
jgi:DNA-binding beta-propeller fold protein YncE